MARSNRSKKKGTNIGQSKLYKVKIPLGLGLGLEEWNPLWSPSKKARGTSMERITRKRTPITRPLHRRFPVTETATPPPPFISSPNYQVYKGFLGTILTPTRCNSITIGRRTSPVPRQAPNRRYHTSIPASLHTNRNKKRDSC